MYPVQQRERVIGRVPVSSRGRKRTPGSGQGESRGRLGAVLQHVKFSIHFRARRGADNIFLMMMIDVPV